MVTRTKLLFVVAIAASMGTGYAIGQGSHMVTALHLLRDAHHEVEQVIAAGTHRDRTLELIDQAVAEVRAGMDRASDRDELDRDLDRTRH
jgi:microcompartment protein CcmL/EutN